MKLDPNQKKRKIGEKNKKKLKTEVRKLKI